MPKWWKNGNSYLNIFHYSYLGSSVDFMLFKINFKFLDTMGVIACRISQAGRMDINFIHGTSWWKIFKYELPFFHRFGMQKLIHADSVMEALPVRPTGTSPGMSYLVPSTSSLQSTERLSQGEMRSDSSELQRQRYASFSCVYHLVSTKYGPPATVHVLRRSTSSTMIHFFTYSISIDCPSLMEMRTMVSVL